MSGIELIAPPAVRWITRTLEDAGYETWAVGGAVRDALLGRPSGDWDLATRAPPKRVRRLFRRTVPIGVEHGTVGILARDGTLYEITTFRKDVETDGRHAVVAFARTIDEDLARRDFTINAIAWHPLRDEVRDPFGGADDLRAGRLRTVGVAEERFGEDFLRILRALRFAGRYELAIDPSTWSALRSLVGQLPTLSPERIREELLKVLADDPTPSRSLRLYGSSGALRVLYPEIDAMREGDRAAWEGRLATLDRLPTGRAHLRLAALLRPLTAPRVAAVLTRLRLSNAAADEVARLAGAPPMPAPDRSEADLRRWLSVVGVARFAAVARMDLAEARARPEGGCGRSDPAASIESVVASWRRVKQVLRKRPPLEIGDLAIDGRALIRMGFEPGPRFGDILAGLLDWVLDDPTRNDADALRARARALGEGRDGEAEDAEATNV